MTGLTSLLIFMEDGMALCTLNNMVMRNQRKSQAYQTMLVDLVFMGVVDRDVGEAMLGYKVPGHIKMPGPVAEAIDNKE